MKKYYFLLFGFLCLWFGGLWLWHPGGLLNKHDWLSTHLENGSYTPLYLEVTDNRTDHPHKTEGWCVDFCAKHSEVRVTKSPCQKFALVGGFGHVKP